MTDTERLADVIHRAVAAATMGLVEEQTRQAASVAEVHLRLQSAGLMEQELVTLRQEVLALRALVGNPPALLGEFMELRSNLYGQHEALEQRLAAVEAREPVAGPVGLIGPVGPVGPIGADGAPGTPGARGTDGTHGRDGLPGVPGRDGADGVDGMMGLQGLPGEKGADGRDGTLESLTMTSDGERTVTFCFKDGTPVPGGSIRFPVMLYRGVYETGKTYEQGDAVTFGGSIWVAREATDTRPESGPRALKAWQMAVKVGRDGREGKPGTKGEPGPRGPQGEPGRDYR